MTVLPVFASEPSATQTIPSKSLIIHKRTPNFIDIEVPIDQVWVGCSKDGPTRDSNSVMVFFALDGDTAYEFHYRRVCDVPMCLETERDYRQMMRGAKTVRLVGIHSREEPFDPEPSTERMPRRFTAVAKTISQVFIRMQAGNRCQAYFPDHCKLPQNYWGGTIPEPAKK